MDKREIKELLVQIKIFYPRFSAVETDQNSNQFVIRQTVADSWHDRIGWMEKARALAILDDYMEQGETKTPGISLWMHSGKTAKSTAWHNAILDRRHNVIRWQPEGGEVYELKIRDYNEQSNTWEDEDGRLWAVPEGGDNEQ